MVLVKVKNKYTARKAGHKPLVKEISQIKPRIGQGKAGLRRKKPQTSELIAQSVEHSQKIPYLPKMHMEFINIPNLQPLCNQYVNPSDEAINRRMMQEISKDIPFNPHPVYWPPPNPVKISMQGFPGKMDINPELNANFKDNSPF